MPRSWARAAWTAAITGRVDRAGCCSPLHCAGCFGLELVGDQVGDDFGVGRGLKDVALFEQLLLQRADSSR